MNMKMEIVLMKKCRVLLLLLLLLLINLFNLNDSASILTTDNVTLSSLTSSTSSAVSNKDQDNNEHTTSMQMMMMLSREVASFASSTDDSNNDSNKQMNNIKRIYHSKYTIDDLLYSNFNSIISDDIDMDPCKTVNFLGDIALPNINYEAQWQSQKLNKSFQQEIEKIKQEVYHEGLQVEEEGLTDIVRKKTKQPLINTESKIKNNKKENNNQSNDNNKQNVAGNEQVYNKSLNDPTLLETGDETFAYSYPLKGTKFNLNSSNIESVIEGESNHHEDNIHATIIEPSQLPNNTSEFNDEIKYRNKQLLEGKEMIREPTHWAKKNNQSSVAHHSETNKIQSDQKNITDNVHNIHLPRKINITPTTMPLVRSTMANRFSNSGGNKMILNNVELNVNDSVKQKTNHQRRRRHQQLYNNNIKNKDENTSQTKVDSYEARLMRLISELSYQSYSEVDSKLLNAQQKKSQQIKDDEFLRSPVHVGDNDEKIIFNKKRTTLEAVEYELTTSRSLLILKEDRNHNALLEQNHHRSVRAATAKKDRIWDFGVIPYEIDGNFSGPHKALFKQAMRHWENFTCIKFVERSPKDHPNYIVFTERTCGCCSFVGKRGNGPQAISIGKNCDKFGIVVHELGHVVGFWHEHTRPDRENHVVIEKNNIMQGQEYNFNKLTEEEVNSLGLPYDYDSIMHYAKNTFSKGSYLDTILPVEVKGRKMPEIGQRVKLSEGDIAQANLLYKCPKCGKTFQDNTGVFSSPNYLLSLQNVEAERCEWRITATHGERIVLNITDLDIFKSNNCRSDFIEIRDGYWHKSPILGKFCGSGRVNELIKTTGSRMLVTYVTNARPQAHRGFVASYEAVCGGNVDLETGGRLESPNYPLEYLPNKECIWKVTVPDDYQVALRFQSFDVENHDNCVYDYVEVRDGDSQDSRLIGVFCGYKLPGDITSTTNKLFVKFVSDGTVQKAGFSATFMKEVDECERFNHGCAHDCINTLGGYECSCKIGYELHSDKKNCEDACGGIIESLNGTITSPSFPEMYPLSKYCVWEIIAPLQYRITLNFTHFELEGNNIHPQECEYDSLTVYSKLNEDNLKRHGIYCGHRTIPLITSEGNVMRIEFTSDNTVQQSGFAAVFFTDIDECAVNNGGCQHECKNTIGSYLCSCHNGYTLHDNEHDCKEGGCKYEITTPNGQIFSPNYPEFYPPKKDCVWHFSTTPGHRIRLSFLFFEMEPHQECAYDHISIYDGDSPDSHTLGRFCGSKLPHPISANTNEMYMVFKSDASVQKKGFVAHHSTACGGHLHATNRVKHFYSHAKYGDHSYESNTDCDWRIEADSGKNVQLTFLTFDLEAEPSCAYDYVEVYGGLDDSSGPFYGKFCGNTNPSDIISMNEALLVRFRSDDTMFFKGFSASYVALNPLQSEEISSESSEAITPFPGSLKSIYKSYGGEIDEDDDDEDENNSNLNKIKYDKKSILGEFID